FFVKMQIYNEFDAIFLYQWCLNNKNILYKRYYYSISYEATQQEHIKLKFSNGEGSQQIIENACAAAQLVHGASAFNFANAVKQNSRIPFLFGNPIIISTFKLINGWLLTNFYFIIFMY
ncbi:hypothetical protein ACJX0J_029120, partial [Zea mays]